MSCNGRGICDCVPTTTEQELRVGDRVRARSWVSGESAVGTIVSVDDDSVPGHPYVVSGLPSDMEDVFRRDELTLYVETGRPESILEEAQRLVYGDRNASYGHPADDYKRTAKIWSAILGVEVTAAQAALCMVAVKISRECHAPKRDNRVDGAGYFAVVDRIRRREDGLE